MPINSYVGKVIETKWDTSDGGWYYRVGFDEWYGPFDSEEEAIAAAESRIDLEDWQ